jgi:putative DNA primase/helicase
MSAEIIELIPPTFGDEALALRFAERHHDDLRYVAAWSRWLIWNGQHWQFDDTLIKLVIAGNHKPGLRSVDEAIRRRLHLIPFTITIPPAERDPDLLKAESTGILQWAVTGCLDWQERGLAPPSIVTEATAAYLEAEDAIAAWISDCCEIDPNHWEKRNALFASWSAWATKAGEFIGSLKRFVERLESRPAG